ncbi:hypothetical protein ACN9UU_09920 [Staphylococcus caprae]|uniref:Uncharacterized protein n=1 Tax=Staphylococcus caprae TaxID=29380 RepID=A0ABN5WAR0_9STAP|nr:hypothetical protein [Staphylococcus caprae]MBX5316633.1 hypothetical protein [Staphylococcus caprae]MBX5322039.1 hypothetical protein [Staphylococcus caprae]MDI0014898.1 hypothetical protein [Staphylococcus caprae]MEB8093627.1 hypothetical protein [Staphylococcus caprae]QDW94786.1 hypothetical protein DWB96_11285 [Staphylococcus caprae]
MSNNDKEHNMPKSQQILLAIVIILAVLNFILGMFVLPLSSFTLRVLQFINVIVFGVFVYRQIKRKGF